MTAELFLVRHAIAEDLTPGGADADRALTPEGRERFEACVRGLDTLGVELDLVLHSPLRRAVETAELLVPLLSERGRTQVTERLAAPLDEALLAEANEPRVALVGHEPWMSECCAWLITGWPDDARGVAFKKGGVAWLRGEPRPGRMVLKSFLPPRVLSALDL